MKHKASGQTWKLTGGIVLHRLVVEDAAQLERRKEEINDAIVNSTCNFADGWYSEVGQVKSGPPTHLLFQKQVRWGT